MEWNEKGLLAESYSDIHSFITLEKGILCNCPTAE